MIQFTAAMVGMLGGPALQVLMVLAIEREPRALSYLCDMTNLSDKTASQAVRKLKTLGMISETGRFVYQIAAQVEQLPLCTLPLFAESEAADAEPGRKISDIALNESMNQSLTEMDMDDSLIDGEQAGNSDLQDEGEIATSHPRQGTEAVALLAMTDDRVTAQELSALGFYGRGLAQLLAIPGLTCAEVEYQVQHAPSLGAALKRLTCRQPIPANTTRGAPSERSKYVQGAYAEFIQH